MEEFKDSFSNLNQEYVRKFVNDCQVDFASGKYPAEVNEGKRLADEFRRQFPNISDKDLGTLIIVFANVFGLIAETPALSLGYVMEKVIASYSYCAANILKGVIDLEDLP